jgi:hypothetical protein
MHWSGPIVLENVRAKYQNLLAIIHELLRLKKWSLVRDVVSPVVGIRMRLDHHHHHHHHHRSPQCPDILGAGLHLLFPPIHTLRE